MSTQSESAPPPASLRFVAVGAALAFAAVALGAFGAHALKPVFAAATDPAQTRGWWETAVRYQMWHALLIIAVGVLAGRAKSRPLTIAGSLAVAGCALFSGSLYLMTLTDMRWLGAITPLGGLCFLGAWLSLGLAVVRR